MTSMPNAPVYGGDAPPSELEAMYCLDNGFTHPRSMEVSHSALLTVLLPNLSNTRPHDGSIRVLDLGSGNGALLRRICDTVPNSLGFGVELDKDKVSRSRTLLAHGRVTIWHGDVYSPEHFFEAFPYHAVIVSAGMLFNSLNMTARLRSCLAARARRVLLYAYYDVFCVFEHHIANAGPYGVEYEDRSGPGTAFIGEQRVFAKMARVTYQRES